MALFITQKFSSKPEFCKHAVLLMGCFVAFHLTFKRLKSLFCSGSFACEPCLLIGAQMPDLVSPHTNLPSFLRVKKRQADVWLCISTFQPREPHPSRCCWMLSTCLTSSAKFICARRWVWDEFIFTGWQSSSHKMVLLEPESRILISPEVAEPRASMKALNGEEIKKSYLWRLHTQTHTQMLIEVHILNATWFFLLPAAMIAFCLSCLACVALEHLRWTVLLQMSLLL